jgi:hypothetical protein
MSLIPPRSVFLKISAITDHFIGTRHTQTTTIKFPTLKNTCKWIGDIMVVKVTITTFFLYTNLKHFLKWQYHWKLWKELIHLLSVEGQPTRAVWAQTWMGVFFVCPVSATIFLMLFLPKPPVNHCADHRLIKTALYGQKLQWNFIKKRDGLCTLVPLYT